jgi:hypothetical protein
MNRKDQQIPNQNQDKFKDKSRDKSAPAKQDSGTFRKDKDLNKNKDIKDKY